MNATWRIATARGSSGAIAIIQIEGDDVDKVMSVVGLPVIEVGRVFLVDLFGIDRGLVMRPAALCIQLMPHGGKAVIDMIVSRLQLGGIGEAGAGRVSENALRAVYPEARSPIEARMLDALSHAHSPRAIDLLLDQPRRWARTGATSDPELDTQRNRLIEPALVVAIGPANIGKSTLLNALAGRAVAIVSDEAGTTRDHVGVLLDLDGLTVRYVDTPGMRAEGPPVEHDARAIARQVVEQADLVLSCGDATATPIRSPDARTFPVALRRDLGEAAFEAEARVSALTGNGLEDLALLIRRRLVSDRAIAEDSPWSFW